MRFKRFLFFAIEKPPAETNGGLDDVMMSFNTLEQAQVGGSGWNTAVWSRVYIWDRESGDYWFPIEGGTGWVKAPVEGGP